MRSSVFLPVLTLFFLFGWQVSFAQTTCMKSVEVEKPSCAPAATATTVVEMPATCQPAPATCKPKSCAPAAGFQLQLVANTKEESSPSCCIICPPGCCVAAASQAVNQQLAVRLEEPQKAQ